MTALSCSNSTDIRNGTGISKDTINALSCTALVPHAAALLVVDCIIVSEKIRERMKPNTIECHVTMASWYSNCCCKCNFTEKLGLDLTRELGYEGFRKTSPLLNLFTPDQTSCVTNDGHTSWSSFARSSHVRAEDESFPDDV